jgi:tRNA(Arg) A34 adenosine deaminase TadA
MHKIEFCVDLPDWTTPFVAQDPPNYPALDARMSLAIELARRNVFHGTGGPFGAAVFEHKSGKLLAVGVNRVVASGLSLAHAEVVALALAQKHCGTFDLSDDALPPSQLVSSSEPCCMCHGAIHWSGIRSLVCGALDEDARAAGFDEGPKPADWAERLTGQGIAVELGVQRDAAAAVLRGYVESGGVIYNPGAKQSGKGPSG